MTLTITPSEYTPWAERYVRDFYAGRVCGASITPPWVAPKGNYRITLPDPPKPPAQRELFEEGEG